MDISVWGGVSHLLVRSSFLFSEKKIVFNILTFFLSLPYFLCTCIRSLSFHICESAQIQTCRVTTDSTTRLIIMRLIILRLFCLEVGGVFVVVVFLYFNFVMILGCFVGSGVWLFKC